MTGRRTTELPWRMGAAALAAGAAGGLAAGIWLRALMRIVALVETSPTASIQDPDGNLRVARIPTFTTEGTLSIIGPPLLMGVVLGLVVLGVRTVWPLIGQGRGLVLGLVLLAFPGVLLIRSTPELEIGNRILSTVLFAGTAFVYGVVYESIVRIGEPSAGRRRSELHH